VPAKDCSQLYYVGSAGLEAVVSALGEIADLETEAAAGQSVVVLTPVGERVPRGATSKGGTSKAKNSHSAKNHLLHHR